MKSNYFDLDDILASSEKIPTRFNLTVPGIGHLEGNPGKPITEGTKVDLPLWLAEVLATTNVTEDYGFIELLQPDSLNNAVKNAMMSDAVTLDLHSILPNYYKLIEKWCLMFNDKGLNDVVKQMLKDRSYEINNFASNTNKQVNNFFILSLDEYEKKLFKKTSESNKILRNWLKD